MAADTSTFGDDAMVALQAETQATAVAYSPHSSASLSGSSAASAASVSTAAYEVDSRVFPSLGDTNWSSPPSQRPGATGGFANATQHVDVTRWFTPDAPRSVGFSLGFTSAAPSAGALANASHFHNGTATPTSLDLGVRWRSRLASGRHLDVSAWAQTPQLAQPSPDAMGLIWQQQQPVYGTRVEMQWASSKTRGLVPEFGAIGVQLQGGSRLVLRARKGGPMLYYRAKF